MITARTDKINIVFAQKIESIGSSNLVIPKPVEFWFGSRAWDCF
jgi:hypothetical protein